MAATSVERGARRQQCQVVTGAMHLPVQPSMDNRSCATVCEACLGSSGAERVRDFRGGGRGRSPRAGIGRDTRFEYYWQLLARALTVTEPELALTFCTRPHRL